MKPARRHRRPIRRAPRRGFTLVEVIVAIVVLSIGVLGLAGTASYVMTQMTGAREQTLAANRATAVMDSLSASPCSSLVGGTTTRRGVTVTWTVAESLRTRWVHQTVQYKPKRGPTKTAKSATVIQCFE